MKPLVETNWLFDNLDKVRIFDATWHLPNSKRNAEDEFKKGHIKGSLFLILINIQIKILNYRI